MCPVFSKWSIRRTLAKCVKCNFSFKRRVSSMATLNMGERARRITWFLTVQLIALVGWIIVQSLFSLSPISSSLSFTAKLIIEAVWWIITLVIMFLLFRREYSGFVKAVLDLEDANRKLRKATSDLLIEMANPSEQEQ